MVRVILLPLRNVFHCCLNCRRIGAVETIRMIVVVLTTNIIFQDLLLRKSFKIRHSFQNKPPVLCIQHFKYERVTNFFQKFLKIKDRSQNRLPFYRKFVVSFFFASSYYILYILNLNPLRIVRGLILVFHRSKILQD